MSSLFHGRMGLCNAMVCSAEEQSSRDSGGRISEDDVIIFVKNWKGNGIVVVHMLKLLSVCFISVWPADSFGLHALARRSALVIHGAF